MGKTKKKAARDWVFVVHKIGPKQKIISGRSSNSGQVSLLFLENLCLFLKVSFLITIPKGSPGLALCCKCECFFWLCFSCNAVSSRPQFSFVAESVVGDGGVKAGGEKGRGAWR